MLVIFLLYFLFFLVFAFSFWCDENRQGGKWPYLSAFIILFLISAFRPVGIDCDSETYVGMYDGVRLVLAEYSFVLISDFAYYVFHDYRIIFVVYAFLGVFIKYFALKRLTPLYFMSLLMYMSNFYILHDFTQIRAGVASALFLFALKYMSDGKRLSALLYMLMAVFFHYSSLAYLPLIVLSNRSLSKFYRWLLAVSVPLAYVIYFMGINLITAIPIPFVGDKLELYQQLQDAGDMAVEHVNVFNLVFIVKIMIYYVLLWKYSVIREKTPIISILLKIYALSIVSFVVLTPLPVLSFRVSELYGIVEIILFPLLYYAVKPEWASRSIVAFIALVLMSINIFYNDLIRI